MDEVTRAHSDPTSSRGHLRGAARHAGRVRPDRWSGGDSSRFAVPDLRRRHHARGESRQPRPAVRRPDGTWTRASAPRESTAVSPSTMTGHRWRPLGVWNLITPARIARHLVVPSGTTGFADLDPGRVDLEVMGVAVRVASLADVVPQQAGSQPSDRICASCRPCARSSPTVTWTRTRTRSRFTGMTIPTFDRPLKVIQWTTGNIGRRSLHAILAARTWSWSGSSRTVRTRWARTPPSCAAGRSRPGSLATNDIDALLALGADACCYNPLWPSIDELVALLESGVNVCSSAAWITGGKQSPEDQERIREGLRAGRHHDLRQRRAPGHDQRDRDDAQRLLRAGRLDRDHRVRRLLDVRVGRDADRDGLLAGPGHPGPGRARPPRERGVRGVRGDDGRRDRRDAGPDDLRRHLHPGDRRQRPRLHADPGGHGRRRDGLPPRLGRRPQRGQRRLQLDHGLARRAAQAAAARPRHPGLRDAQHAHGAALPAAGRLDRGRVHGSRDDLHGHAGHQRGAVRRGRRAGDRDAGRPAADHRTG